MTPDPQTVWNHYLTWMNNLSSVGTRLTRFYSYEFQGAKGWDTGLIDFNGSSAPASQWRSFVLCDIQTRLGRRRAEPPRPGAATRRRRRRR